MLRHLVLLSLLLLVGCQQHTPAQGDMPADFVRFYERFHTDSAFQMAHIQFPLKGLPDYADESIGDPQKFYWHEEDWVLHRPVDLEQSEFRREFTLHSENMIVERTLHDNKPLFTERRFFKLATDWKLVYYSGINSYRLAEEAQK